MQWATSSSNPDSAIRCKPVPQVVDGVGHRGELEIEVVDRRLLVPLGHDRGSDRGQPCDVDRNPDLERWWRGEIAECRDPGMPPRPIVEPARQHRGDILEGDTCQQAGEQLVALFEQSQLVVEIHVIGAGKEPSRLQLDEGGGNEDELAGHLEVEPPHLLEMEAGTRQPGRTAAWR